MCGAQRAVVGLVGIPRPVSVVHDSPLEVIEVVVRPVLSRQEGERRRSCLLFRSVDALHEGTEADASAREFEALAKHSKRNDVVESAGQLANVCKGRLSEREIWVDWDDARSSHGRALGAPQRPSYLDVSADGRGSSGLTHPGQESSAPPKAACIVGPGPQRGQGNGNQALRIGRRSDRSLAQRAPAALRPRSAAAMSSRRTRSSRRTSSATSVRPVSRSMAMGSLSTSTATRSREMIPIRRTWP